MSQESTLFMEIQTTTRTAIARRLRELADNIESRQFKMGDYQVSLPEQIDMKVELDEGTDNIELEIEIGWRPQYFVQLSEE
jgi:amphi-Trp domain-containing protein